MVIFVHGNQAGDLSGGDEVLEGMEGDVEDVVFGEVKGRLNNELLHYIVINHTFNEMTLPVCMLTI